jgi:hypothetical protein
MRVTRNPTRFTRILPNPTRPVLSCYSTRPDPTRYITPKPVPDPTRPVDSPNTVSETDLLQGATEYKKLIFQGGVGVVS